ncbi:F-box/kelch-repeat protein At1g80440-like [Zingiber officinale]|uniref:F-box/kelch-repeat protein At1g80440-like n=1 Tax=Zingiber officinale TaxID=94328 RepID=UPI001C4B67C2|nr:F-box/kelch-repeat protein At1g80440-like [Zingiber officinale]
METELIPGLPDDVALQCLLRLPFYSISVARGVCRRWRRELSASSSFYHLRKAAGLARPVFIMLFYDIPSFPLYRWRLAFYEPATGSWGVRSLTDDSLRGKQHCWHVVVVERELVLVGGWDESNWKDTAEVNIYDLVTGDWRPGAPIPRPMQDGCDFAVGPQNAFVSGWKDDLSSTLVYDTATDAWMECHVTTQEPSWSPWLGFMSAADLAAHEEEMMYECREKDEDEKLEVVTWCDGDKANLWRSLGLSSDNLFNYRRQFFVFLF